MLRHFWWVSGGLVAALILSVTLGPLAALLSQQETSALLLWQDSYLTHVARFSLKTGSTFCAAEFAAGYSIARALFHRQFPGKTLLLHLFAIAGVARYYCPLWAGRRAWAQVG